MWELGNSEWILAVFFFKHPTLQGSSLGPHHFTRQPFLYWQALSDNHFFTLVIVVHSGELQNKLPLLYDESLNPWSSFHVFCHLFLIGQRTPCSLKCSVDKINFTLSNLQILSLTKVLFKNFPLKYVHQDTQRAC